jgi:hypothetical protein
MSKEVFEALREDELRARIDIPYMRYKELQEQWEYQEEILYWGSYHPNHEELYKSNEEWKALQRIKTCVATEIKELESKLRVDGKTID